MKIIELEKQLKKDFIIFVNSKDIPFKYFDEYSLIELSDEFSAFYYIDENLLPELEIKDKEKMTTNLIKEYDDENLVLRWKNEDKLEFMNEAVGYIIRYNIIPELKIKVE